MVVRELNSMDEVTDDFVDRAFAVRDFSRALRYMLLNAISKTVQCSDDDLTVQLQYVKKDGYIKETL